MKLTITLICCLICSSISFSQKFTKAIEDNSFLIEEAYNQEDRVVQHIFSMQYLDAESKDVYFDFTQEWPLFGQTSQLSISLPFTSLASGTAKGIGDAMLNYRYQFFNKENWAAVSPRFSLILPTGNREKGLVDGKLGFEINLPASKRLSNDFVVHANAGVTLIPNAIKILNEEKLFSQYHVGGSLIYLYSYNLNFMIEFLNSFTTEYDILGESNLASETILSPGFRLAIDLGNLQIVPGFAFPINLSDENSISYFGYLSFEHPF